MKKLFYLLSLSVVISCTNNKPKNSLVSGKVEKLATDFQFTEGPASDSIGNVYFTDIPANTIFKWTIENKLETYRTNSGGANGLYFDQNQNLFICVADKGEILAIDKNGQKNVIASQFEGKAFNQPNDLWVHPNGGIYFTDPKYGKEAENFPQDGMHVYYISPDFSKLKRVCEDYEKPNGIIGTPDGKTLYITDNKAGKTFKYTIETDGSLTNKELFVNKGCDGMTIDSNGNIYLTPSKKKRVEIYNSQKQLLEYIKLPELPSNVCFGGAEQKDLYITARTSLYRVKMKSKGVRQFQ